MNSFIYCLIDPRNNDIRYIGKTSNVKNRLKNHISEAIKSNSKTHKVNWIKSVLKENLTPMIDIIDEVSESSVNFWEKHYISLYKSWGINLTNMTDGGDGYSSSYFTPEIRKKISNNQSGEKNGFYGHKHNLDLRKKWSNERKISNGGKNNSMFNKKHTVESKLKMSLKKRNKYNGDKNPRAKKLYQYDLNNNLIKIWNCAKECADIYQISRGNISNAAKHNTNTNSNFKMLKKFIFKFS